MIQLKDEEMKQIILLRKGEARYPLDLPVEVEKLQGGKLYWLARYVPFDYEAAQLTRLPRAPFDTQYAAEEFLNNNWPKWLGECDVVFDVEQLYVCDDEGEPVYGRDVTMHEIYYNLYNGVNFYAEASFDKKASDFAKLLFWEKAYSKEEALFIAEFLKGRKQQWIEQEPKRIEKHAKQFGSRPGIGKSLSGLRGSGPQIRECDLEYVPASNLVLSGKCLYDNVSFEPLNATATDSTNTWRKA